MSIRTSASGGVAIFVPDGSVKVNKGLILNTRDSRGIGSGMSGKAPSAQFHAAPRSGSAHASRTASCPAPFSACGTGVAQVKAGRLFFRSSFLYCSGNTTFDQDRDGIMSYEDGEQPPVSGTPQPKDDANAPVFNLPSLLVGILAALIIAYVVPAYLLSEEGNGWFVFTFALSRCVTLCLFRSRGWSGSGRLSPILSCWRHRAHSLQWIMADGFRSARPAPDRNSAFRAVMGHFRRRFRFWTCGAELG